MRTLEKLERKRLLPSPINEKLPKVSHAHSKIESLTYKNGNPCKRARVFYLLINKRDGKAPQSMRKIFAAAEKFSQDNAPHP